MGVPVLWTSDTSEIVLLSPLEGVGPDVPWGCSRAGTTAYGIFVRDAMGTPFPLHASLVPSEGGFLSFVGVGQSRDCGVHELPVAAIINDCKLGGRKQNFILLTG